MQINIDKYELILNEREMYDLIFAIAGKIKDSIPHFAFHSGMTTMEENYGDSLLLMLRTLCYRMGREDLYNLTMAEIEQGINKAREKSNWKAKGENNAN